MENMRKDLPRSALLALLQLDFGALSIGAKIGCNDSRTDMAHECESAFIPVLDAVYDLNLHNAQALETNNECFDLYDTDKKVWVQITVSNRYSSKKKRTIKQFEKYKKKSKEYADYILHIFFVASDRTNLRKESSEDCCVYSLAELYKSLIEQNGDPNAENHISNKSLSEIEKNLADVVFGTRETLKSDLSMNLPSITPLKSDSLLVQKIRKLNCKDIDFKDQETVKYCLKNWNLLQKYLHNLPDETRKVLAAIYAGSEIRENGVFFNMSTVENVPRRAGMSISDVLKRLQCDKTTSWYKQDEADFYEADDDQFEPSLKLGEEKFDNPLVDDFPKLFKREQITAFIIDNDFSSLYKGLKRNWFFIFF